MLQAMRAVADALPEPGAELASGTLSPQREEERTAASGFRRAALRMFAADNQVGRPKWLPVISVSQELQELHDRVSSAYERL